MKKKIPAFKSDAEAERFVETADLAEYDLSGFRRVQFEFEKKTAQLNMRVPKPLLDAVKKRAKARGIRYTRFVREAVEQALSRPERAGAQVAVGRACPPAPFHALTRWPQI